MKHFFGKIDVLQVKNEDDFQEKITDIFNFLSINQKYNLAGSSHMKTILYNTDFDLNERIINDDTNNSHLENHLKKIAEVFQKKFEDAYKNPNMFITDFKCGVDNHYTDTEKDHDKYILRWSREDMKKGYKILWGNRKRYLWECLLDKTVLKLDLIVLVNNVFEEFSEVYFIKIGDNMNHEQITKNDLKNSIYENYVKYNKEGMQYKALKRMYSFYKLDSKYHQQDLKLLTDFFNKEPGLIYKNKSELGVLLEILNQKFRPVHLEDIVTNLQIIKQSLSYVYKIPMKDVSERIDHICSLRSKEGMKKEIEKLENYLQDVINESAIHFVKYTKIDTDIKKYRPSHNKTTPKNKTRHTKQIHNKTIVRRVVKKDINPYNRMSKYMWNKK